jgi:hypothetical protein
VPCEPKAPSTEVSDNERVICVLKWYLSNPIDTARLSFNKSVLFWAPWSGPLSVNGTMARNPWLKISPIQEIATSSQSGQSFVFGAFGKLVSWSWTIGQLVFLVAGYRVLRRMGTHEKFLAYVLISPVILSWVISLGTIGDNRFRVPTMSMSLALQLVAFLAIRKKINDRVGSV